MIKVLIGDIFQSKAQTLVNTVNCVGVMGKGIALEFKKRFPAMYEDYKARCDSGRLHLGEPYLYSNLLGVSVVNFPTKDHWRSPSRLADIVRGLDYFIARFREWDIRSVAMPPLGAGNGGLEWALVGPVIYQKLSALGIPVELYAPYGTPQHQLTPAFLSQTMMDENVKGRQQQRLNPVWLTILEVVDQVSQQPYACQVGRTIFQKIAYILTEQGVETGFRFGQGSYGPFSADVQEAVKVFANTNLIEEKTLGRMTAIGVGPNYPQFKERHADVLSNYRKKIDKTVDLFSRIKSTEQAEEVTTVLFAARRLKQIKDDPAISEQDLYDYILGWKKAWNSDDKQQALASAIRNLAMLGWVKLRYSDLNNL
ncbi:MAG: macro domain-containing protein [Acidobacteriota bacterium]|nr:macro domain-containing protein [Acidobacteriota bacterium]